MNQGSWFRDSAVRLLGLFATDTRINGDLGRTILESFESDRRICLRTFFRIDLQTMKTLYGAGFPLGKKNRLITNSEATKSPYVARRFRQSKSDSGARQKVSRSRQPIDWQELVRGLGDGYNQE